VISRTVSTSQVLASAIYTDAPQVQIEDVRESAHEEPTRGTFGQTWHWVTMRASLTGGSREMCETDLSSFENGVPVAC
jgi:hypothetical protein